MPVPLPENFQTSVFAPCVEPVWPLIQLPNGNWIDPSEVTRIAAYRASYIDLDRIVVNLRYGSETIDVLDLPSAEHMRDEIAALVNSTRVKRLARTERGEP